MRTLLPAVLLFACDGSTVDQGIADGLADVATDTTPDAPTPWVFDAGDTTQSAPALGPGELVAAIRAATEVAARIDPEAVRDLYDAVAPYEKLVDLDGAGCPYVIDYGYSLYWVGDCTDGDGVTYEGYGLIGDDYGDDGFYRYLAGRIIAPDGTWIAGAGEASLDPYDGRLAILEGYSGGGPRGPASAWLDATGGGRFETQIRYRAERGSVLAYYDLELRAPELLPPGVDSVALERLTFMNRAAGAYCDLEPGGTVGVRTPDGQWYEIAFDGRTRDAEEEELALCDGCGRTTFRDQTLAPTCLDPAIYFNAIAGR